MADSGGGVALPEIRELLFADLPPLTAIETFAAVADLRDLALAAAREDEFRSARDPRPHRRWHDGVARSPPGLVARATSRDRAAAR